MHLKPKKKWLRFNQAILCGAGTVLNQKVVSELNNSPTGGAFALAQTEKKEKSTCNRPMQAFGISEIIAVAKIDE